MPTGSGLPLPSYITEKSLSEFIDAALREDIGDGDHSSLAAVDADRRCKAQLLVKDEGVLAGMVLAEKLYAHYDNNLVMTKFKSDGEAIKKGDVAFVVEGSARSILSTERLVLNCMQRMSGIATLTRSLSKLLEGTSARLMDTRKTTPNFRMLEKWAVLIGGGHNHRFALFDMVMLKDNHVDMSGGIRSAIEKTQRYLLDNGKKLRIEVETRNINDVATVLETGGVDVIMLDNMSTTEMKKAVTMIGGKYKTEASGGITEANIREVALCGVDYISVGALTHSVRSLDLSLKVIK